MSLARIAPFGRPAGALHWNMGHPAEVNMPSEAVLRFGSLLLIVWLIIGAIAAGQRHYYGSSDPSCSRVGNIAVTILAGPLNYVGVNPKIACKAPKPS